MTFNNIPIFIVLQRSDGGDFDDDVDSVMSFGTAGGSIPSYMEDLWDSESRWVESSTVIIQPSCSSSSNHPTIKSKSNKRSSLPQCPQHPQRSLSYSSDQLNKQQSPLSATDKAIRTTTPSRQKRTTRLTRMADRAKAVACRAPARRKSFHRRSSMPPPMPLRKGSANCSLSSSYCSLTSSTHCSSSRSPGIVVARTSRRHSLNMSTLTAMDGVVATTAGIKTHERRNSTMECRQPQCSPSRSSGLEHLQIIQRRSTAAGRLTNTTTTTANTNPDGSKIRRSTGCFQITCGAGLLNQPPRLPQRCPSDSPPRLDPL